MDQAVGYLVVFAVVRHSVEESKQRNCIILTSTDFKGYFLRMSAVKTVISSETITLW